MFLSLKIKILNRSCSCSCLSLGMPISIQSKVENLLFKVLSFTKRKIAATLHSHSQRHFDIGNLVFLTCRTGSLSFYEQVVNMIKRFSASFMGPIFPATGFRSISCCFTTEPPLLMIWSGVSCFMTS